MPAPAQPLRNFYDVVSDTSGGTGSAREVTPPHRHPRRHEHYETIHIAASSSDSGGDDGERWGQADGAESAPTAPTSEYLEEAVAQSVREVHRIDLLIFRAVWKHLAGRKPEGKPQQPQKATETRAASSTALTRAASSSVSSAAGPTRSAASSGAAEALAAGAVRAPSPSRHSSSPSLLRDPSLLFFPHRGSAAAAVEPRHSVLVLHERPFLPPSRFPAPQDVGPEEYARFNRNLYRAVVEASRRGMLRHRRRWPAAPDPPAATPRRDPSPASLLSQRRRGQLQLVGSPPPPAVTAAAAAGDSRSAPPPSSARPRPLPRTAASRGGGGEAVGEWPSSLSVLILRVAKARAVATLFLRQLRLDAHRRRAVVEDVGLRYQYYRQRRVLRAWQSHAAMARGRRQLLLSLVVELWQDAVAEGAGRRAALRQFREGLRARRAAYDACVRARTAGLLRRWQRRFTAVRLQRSLHLAADNFAAARQERRRRPPPALLTDAAAEERLVDPSDAFLARRARGRLFAHWRARAAVRRRVRVADRHHAETVQRRVVRRLLERSAAAAAALVEKYAGLRRAAQDGDVNGCGAGAFSSPPRCVTVHVAAPPLPCAMRYRAAAAARIADGRALLESFGHWRSRALNRQADRQRAGHLQRSAVRRWVGRLCSRRDARALLHEALARWQERYRCRADVAAAAAVHDRSLLAWCFSVRWHSRLQRRAVQRGCVLAECFRTWWARAALRAAARVLRTTERQRLFQHWRARAAFRVGARTRLLVADTVRETILLLGCVRRWRDRADHCRRTRLSMGVLLGLRAQQQMALCFGRWKRRAFGPHLPPPLPPAPSGGAGFVAGGDGGDRGGRLTAAVSSLLC